MSQTALQPSQKLNPSFEVDFELDPPPTPVQVREWVADLFRQDRINLAIALAEAGLALYPDSEDVLVIAALVSEVQQDWTYSRQLLEHLIKIQAGNTPAEVWHHYARVLRCLGEPAQALRQVERGLRQHPHASDLKQLATELQQDLMRPLAPTPIPGTEPA
jgi:tetratricopeptide (TPR) repeat protein